MQKKFFSAPESIRYAVIGDPVAHSRSPGMQNAAFAALGLGAPYGKFHVTPPELPDFIAFARERLLGVNLTVPHKRAVLPLLDEIDPAAALAGSVNTLVIREGRIKGYSTDGYGLVAALKEEFGIAPAGKRILFVGAGGAAQATAFTLAEAGAFSISIANRSFDRAEELASAVGKAYPLCATKALPLADREGVRAEVLASDVLIQATSLGLKPEDPPPFDLEALSGAHCAVFDTIYRRTLVLDAAGKAGLHAAGGRAMLIHQGARSFAIWTGKEADLDAMRRGFEEEPTLC